MSYTDPRVLRDQAARLLATADAIEDGTWQFVVENHATPTHVAKHLGISVQAANNRLRKLYDRGLLNREKVKVEGGGRAFHYRLTLEALDV